MIIKSANGKQIGQFEISDRSIVISNNTKPVVVIEDGEIIRRVLSKDESIVPVLRSKYELGVGEIAALYGVSYQTMYKRMKEAGINTAERTGRRSSTYGMACSESRKLNISLGNRGKTANKGYERTPEIRKQISDALRAQYQSGRIHVNGDGISLAWRSGKYERAPMGRGIQGYFRSEKTASGSGDIYFRSLLELFYLVRLEKSDSVVSIAAEPVTIELPNGRTYIPDFLVNDHLLVELKSRKLLEWSGEDNGRFPDEVRSAVEYCSRRGWEYQIIYDTDIGFETSAFKREIVNHDYISTYGIRFNEPERVIGHKK